MKNEKEEVFRTWDQMCLDELKELGKSSLTKWSKAMGYTNSTCMTRTANNLIKKGLVRGVPNPGGKVRRYYEAV